MRSSCFASVCVQLAHGLVAEHGRLRYHSGVAHGTLKRNRRWMMSNNTRVLITGVTGPVGSFLADYLLTLPGIELHAFKRWRSDTRPIQQ